MAVKCLPILLFIAFSSSVCQSQDSSAQKLRFHIGLECYNEQHYLNEKGLVNMPVKIRKYRQASTRLPVRFDTISDNPFMHDALYMAFKTKTVVAGRLVLKADLYAEYRGISYGTYHKDNLVLFPVIEIASKDTLRIGKKELVIQGKVGQFLNEKMEEGLMIYNIDLQGAQVGVRYKNEELSYTGYGDLAASIGLNTDDVISLAYMHYMHNDSTRIGFSWTTGMPPGWATIPHSYFNLFASGYILKNMRLFGQIGYKISPAAFEEFVRSGSKIAFVAGVEKEYTKQKLYVGGKAEVRYYGAGYNTYHHEFGFKYRDSARDAFGMFANSTGKYLYPLRKFNTPFSQWAVFTEYAGHDIWGFTATGTCRYALAKKAGIGLDYDINWIWGKLDESYYDNGGGRSTSFVYPFFKVWASYLPLKECAVSLFLSNKAMNLDVSYPTLYLMKKPFVGFQLEVKI
jgi:hypothetical protein